MNSRGTISTDGVLSAHLTTTLSNGYYEDDLIMRTITEYRNYRLRSLGISAFQECSSLTSVDLPLVTIIRGKAFQACSSLISADFPLVTNISTQAFYGCSSLTSVNLPRVTSILDKTFMGCSSLTSVNFPLVINIGAQAFNGCSSLTSMNLPRVTSIYNKAFQDCSNLTALILRSVNRVTLSAISAFYNTPIESGTGYIYVPAVLANSYKTATNWSVYASQFRAIEDYPDICGG